VDYEEITAIFGAHGMKVRGALVFKAHKLFCITQVWAGE
jgi:hypothetical protein